MIFVVLELVSHTLTLEVLEGYDQRHTYSPGDGDPSDNVGLNTSRFA